MSIFHQTLRYIIALTLLLLGTGIALSMETREFAVIEVNGLNMRSGPDVTQPVVRVLQKGAKVRILASETDWLQILYDGETGYIASNKEFLSRYVIHAVRKSEDSELETTKVKAAEIARKIREGKAEVSGFEKKERNVLEELETIDRETSGLLGMLREIRSAMPVVDKRITEIRREIKRTQAAIAEQSAYAESRLVSLYKLNRLGTMNLLASAGSLQEMFRRKAAIEMVIAHDEKIVNRLMKQRVQLTQLVSRLEAEKNSKMAMLKNYRQTLSQLSSKKAVREKLLAEIKSQKSDRLSMLKYLQNAARHMDKTMASLNREGYTARKPFSRFQGLLKPPVKGKIISKFGKYIEPQSGVANFRNGIEIRSERGAPVRAVFDGKTIFADWLKGYGRVIIVAHGNHCHTVYAHVEEIFCKKGETVEAGQVIATVGETGSINGPALYFEVRQNGKPVNPLEWMVNG